MSDNIQHLGRVKRELNVYGIVEHLDGRSKNALDNVQDLPSELIVTCSGHC
jgi:hypothetical protein